MEATRGELRKWNEVILVGEERANLALTELQRKHLLTIFFKMHNRELTFFEKIHSVKVIHMQVKAEREEGPNRIEALVEAGDVCLVKAGFPKIISRHVRKLFRNPCMLAIRVGKQCYESLAETTWSSAKRGPGWDEPAYGFDEMVEVLWASQENGYPELEELMEMALVAEYRCATRAIRKIHKSIPLHIRET
jgi:hypothetical protein